MPVFSALIGAHPPLAQQPAVSASASNLPREGGFPGGLSDRGPTIRLPLSWGCVSAPLRLPSTWVGVGLGGSFEEVWKCRRKAMTHSARCPSKAVRGVHRDPTSPTQARRTFLPFTGTLDPETDFLRDHNPAMQ